MLREAAKGAAAGVLGTAVLNMTTYADMALRGRPANHLPDKVAKRLADRAHLPLRRSDEAQAERDNRAEGLGGLLGYTAGALVGAAYGAVRSRNAAHGRNGGSSVLLAGPTLAAATLVAGNTTTVATGVDDPHHWGIDAWTMHALPHFLFGIATAAAYRAMTSRG